VKEGLMRRNNNKICFVKESEGRVDEKERRKGRKKEKSGKFVSFGRQISNFQICLYSLRDREAYEKIYLSVLPDLSLLALLSH
jgi:hypothetical protein